MQRKVVVYIAASVDGYIAAPDGDLSFLSKVEKEGEDYGYGIFIATVDTVVLGKNTYDKVLSMGYPFPHADKEAYNITRTERATEGTINFYTGDVVDLVGMLKEQNGKTIFIDGGAYVVNRLLQHGLVDELYLSYIPVLLGGGIALFKRGNPLQNLELQTVKTFDTGLVQLHYRFVKV
ncbi:dihydrofolate reductase family protein [Lacibacter sp. H375]|uniref:dihydrofolate reductase family protein n=1 Tax=Lacibacter sp. H375 TaxID=3133424 RepID=UPI0030BE0A60